MSGFEPRPRGDETSGFRGAGNGVMLLGSFAVVVGGAMLLVGPSCEGTTHTANVVHDTVQPDPLQSPEPLPSSSERPTDPEQSVCTAPDRDVKSDVAMIIVGGAIVGLGVVIRRADERWVRGIPAHPKVTPTSLPPLDDEELGRFMEAAKNGRLDEQFGPPPPGLDD